MKERTNTLAGLMAIGLLALTPTAQYAADGDNPAQTIPFSLGVEGGTTGLGGNASWRFMDHFGVETGFDYFDYTYNGTIKDNRYKADFRLMSEPLNLEIFPWSRSSFHLSLGMLFNENQLSGTDVGSVTLNHIKYTGNLNLNYKPDVVDPYVGIGGNLYFDHAHHWSLMGALGVAFAGDGDVSLTGTQNHPALNAQFNNGLAIEKAKVRSYANDLQFWPVIKIGLNYSF